MVKRTGAGPLGSTDDKRQRAVKNYYDDSKKQHYANDFFSFKDSAIIPTHHIYKHTHRCLIYLMHPVNTADDGIATMITDIFQQGHKSGHMKDIGATELASLIDYCEGIWYIFGQLRNEYAAVTLLDNPTFDDATTTTGAAHVFWKPETFNTFIETLEARNLVIPDFLVYMLKKFTGVRIELHEAYEIYGNQIPSSYMVMGARLLTLTNMETARNTFVSNKGEAISMMNKYGIGYKQFSRDMITSITEHKLNSPEATFWFDCTSLYMYGKTKQLIFTGVNDVDFAGGVVRTGWKIWLYNKQVPDEEKFTFIFDAHHATNNPYGGLFAVLSSSAVEGSLSLLGYGIDDATPTIINSYTTAEDKYVPWLWFVFGEDDKPAAGEFELALVGTELTANSIVHPSPDSQINPSTNLRSGLWRTSKTVSHTALVAFALRKLIAEAHLK